MNQKKMMRYNDKYIEYKSKGNEYILIEQYLKGIRSYVGHRRT